MTSDRSKGEPEQSQPDPRNTQMTTSFDSSLRTDYRALGLCISVILLFVLTIGYVSNDYTLLETVLLLAVALLSTVIPFTYNAFRER